MDVSDEDGFMQPLNPNKYVIGPFNFWIALTLVAITGAIGYIGGFFLAALWNWLHREPRQLLASHAERLTPAPR